MQRTQLKTIQVIPANQKGKIFVIADLHGNFDILKAVISKLAPNDKLIILGDTVDKGKKSEDVIYGLIKLKKLQALPEVTVLCGDHEDFCLKTIAAMDLIAREFARAPTSTDAQTFFNARIKSSKEIMLHVHNYGVWIVNLFYDEILQKKITLSNGAVVYGDSSKIKAIKEFIESLPHIITLDGDDPMNGVHANMPVSDTELKNRIAESKELTLEEIIQAMWARDKGHIVFKNAGRTKDSIITYCGHSIVIDGAPCVRPETNTINLDVGCFDTNAILLVNHTDKTAELVGDYSKNKPEVIDALQNACTTVNEYLARFRIKPKSSTKTDHFQHFQQPPSTTDPSSSPEAKRPKSK